MSYTEPINMMDVQDPGIRIRESGSHGLWHPYVHAPVVPAVFVAAAVPDVILEGAGVVTAGAPGARVPGAGVADLGGEEPGLHGRSHTRVGLLRGAGGGRFLRRGRILLHV